MTETPSGGPITAPGAPPWTPSGTPRPSFAPSVSPDATSFAHIVDDGGYPRAVQRRLDGLTLTTSRQVRLPVEGPVDRVLYSPDGRWLAVQTLPHAGARSQVWAVTNDPGDPTARRLDEAGTVSADLVGWDGPRVALTFEQTDGVGVAALADPATGELTVIDRRLDGRLLDSWAGTAVVRVGHRGDRSLRVLSNGHEVAVCADDPGATSDAAQIIDDHGHRWLPRAGRLMAPGPGGYVRVLVRSDYVAERMRLLLVTVCAGDYTYRVLAERSDADLDEFVASADGSTVALLWNVDGGRSELQLLELSDGSLHAPTPLPGSVAEELTISATGSLVAMTVQGPGQERSVELFAPRTGEWVAAERPVLDRDVEPPRSLTMAARDGFALHAWWYVSPIAQGPAPVFVDFHGGPEGQARPTYDLLTALLLACGWHVVRPNIRGSAGFGRATTHADDGPRRWAGITDALDVGSWLVACGIADPDRMVIGGRSYGGYLTLAVLAFHPGRYVAGVSTCGMSDFHTFYAQTEPWIARAAVTKYGDPSLDGDLLRALSPLARADAIEVPVLFVHGDRDSNVPPQESVQMAAALRDRGVPVEMILVPDEGHEFYKPENRAAVARATRDWLLATVADRDGPRRPAGNGRAT